MLFVPTEFPSIRNKVHSLFNFGLCFAVLLATLSLLALPSRLSASSEYKYTLGCAPDRDPSTCRMNFGLMERLSNSGNAEAQFLYSLHLYEEQSERYVEYLTASADQGFVWSQIMLGTLLAKDRSTYSDKEKIAKTFGYLNGASQQNSVLGSSLLGFASYIHGNILNREQQVTDGIRLIAKSAVKNEPLALMWISRRYVNAYRKGLGSDRLLTYQTMISSLMKSVSLGWPEAAYSLALIYSDSAKTRFNITQTLMWFRIAHLMGHEGAMQAHWRYAARASVSGARIARSKNKVASWLRQQVKQPSSPFAFSQKWCEQSGNQSEGCAFQMAINHYDCSLFWVDVVPEYLRTQEYRSCMKAYYANDGKRKAPIIDTLDDVGEEPNGGH